MEIQKCPDLHLRNWSIAIKQALRWQTLAPKGISGTNLIGASSTEEPQLTSKLVFLARKQERLDELGFVALAACITCDFSLMTNTEEFCKLISSTPEEELDEEELDVSSLSESESGAGGIVAALDGN